jgi:hypothetical protein
MILSIFIVKDTMKTFIKQKLRESLLEEEQLNEVNWKGLAAGAAMTLGTLGAQGQTTEPTTQAPTTQTTQPTQKKPMYGTPEQRAAAKAKREGQRKINYENFIKGAYIKGFIEQVDDEEFKSSCDLTMNQEADYLDGTSFEMPDIIYRELKDGRKVKINIKKYQKYIKNQSKQDDVALDGLQGPNFKATSCGISKAAARQSKKDWKKK